MVRGATRIRLPLPRVKVNKNPCDDAQGKGQPHSYSQRRTIFWDCLPVTPRVNGCGFRLGLFRPGLLGEEEILQPFRPATPRSIRLHRTGRIFTACRLLSKGQGFPCQHRRTKSTRPHQRLSGIGRDYMQITWNVNGWGLRMR
jgi:hypothetical protein